MQVQTTDTQATLPDDSDATGAPDAGTLARLAEAERLAYRRYQDSCGNERAAQIWLACLRSTAQSAGTGIADRK